MDKLLNDFSKYFLLNKRNNIDHSLDICRGKTSALYCFWFPIGMVTERRTRMCFLRMRILTQKS